MTRRTVFYHGREAVLRIEPGDRLSTPIAPPNIYSDRALAMSTEGDIVMLHPEDWTWRDWLLHHYRSIGLRPASHVIKLLPFEDLATLDDYELSTFLFCEKSHRAQPDAARFSITRLLNDKNDFLDLCHRLGRRIPQTFCYRSKSELQSLNQFAFPLYLKVSTSFTGMGVFRVRSAAHLESLVSKLGQRIKFQLQEDLANKNVLTFLNLQYHAAEGRAERTLLTEQVLVGCEHVGNMYDPSNPYAAAWEETDLLAAFAARNGMKGFFAFDVAICRQGGQQRPYVIECNPRPNGSSYPTAIARRLGYRHAWTAKTIATQVHDLEQLDLGELAYSSSRGSGIVVHIASTLHKGKLGVTILAPTFREQQKLEDRLLCALPSAAPLTARAFP